MIKRLFIALFVLFFLKSATAATWYVDSSVGTSGAGTSWATAMKTFKDAFNNASITSGDTVQVSGGSSGNTQTYDSSSTNTYPGQFFPPNGTTWIIGQDTSHNGTAIFDAQGGGSWLEGNYTNVTISGKYLTGSDGIKHFKLKDNTTTDSVGVCNNADTVHFEYIDFGSQPCNSTGAGLLFNPGHAVEVNNCSLTVNGTTTANIATYGIFDGTGYDQNKFHDNAINVPHNTTSGLGVDGVNWVGSSNTTGGISIYNNTITAYSLPAYSGNQHQDGFQSSQGSYYKIYNNRFTDIIGYNLFFELPTNGNQYNHVRAYNNIGVLTLTNGTQGFVVGFSSANSETISDFVFANNVADGYGTGDGSFTMRNPITHTTDPTACTNTYFYNNVAVNAISGNTIDAAITQAGNVSVSAGNAASYYTSWTSTGSGSNTPSNANYVLLSAATPLIHTGTNVSSLGITTDFTGAPYANPPSVGPYEFGGSSGGGGSALSGSVTLKGGVILH